MSADDLLDRGSRALDEGDIKSALQCFQQAVELQDSIDGRILLAEAQIENGSFSKAHENIAAGLTLDSENIDLLFILGDLYLEENRNAEAISTYQQIIDLYPDETDAWVSKAMAYVNIDDLDAAEMTCRKALEKDPGSAFALNALGDIHVAQAHPESAIQCFERAVELEPENPQPYLSLAELYYDAENLAEAETYCLKGLELDASIPAGYLTLGNICLDLDRTQEAVENYQQFLRLEKSPAAKQIRDEVSAVIEGLK